MTTRGAASLVLVMLAALGGAAEARGLRCPGAFARSCVRPLYRGFVAKGARTRDIRGVFSAGTVTDCWANGARATLTGFATGAGASQLVDRRGRTRLTGETTVARGEVTIRYRRGRREWTIVRAGDGAFTVACPNGTVESYAAAEVAAGGCGPIADCGLGACP